MKGIEDMYYYTETTSSGKFIGKVREFADLRTSPKTKKLDAIDAIITLTRERIREIGP